MIRYVVIIWEVPTDVTPPHVHNGALAMYYIVILLIVAYLVVALFVVTHSQQGLAAAQALTPAEPVALYPVQIAFSSSLDEGVSSTALQQHLAHAYVERHQAQGTLPNGPGVCVLVELEACTPHALGVEYTLYGTVTQTIFSDGCELNTETRELPPYSIIILNS